MHLGLVYTFIWATSDCAGTFPSLFFETLDSALRRSSPVVWKVDSDIVDEERVVDSTETPVWVFSSGVLRTVAKTKFGDVSELLMGSTLPVVQ